MSIQVLGLILISLQAIAATKTCAVSEIGPGGDVAVERVIAGPLPRVHEIVVDAMQAAGVLLFKDTEQSVQGERSDERTKVLRLPGGDEAISAALAPASTDGGAGVRVRVETSRRGGKRGMPKRTWSEAVLNHASCLSALLSVEDLLHRPAVAVKDGIAIRIPGATGLEVRSRRFFFNTDIKPNQVVPFETASAVVIDGSVAIPPGLLVAASLDQNSDVKEFGGGAKGQLIFKYVVLRDGTRLPLRGTVDLKGKGAGAAAAVLGVAFGAATAAAVRGFGYAIPAGTLFSAEVDGEHEVRAPPAVAPSPN